MGNHQPTRAVPHISFQTEAELQGAHECSHRISFTQSLPIPAMTQNLHTAPSGDKILAETFAEMSRETNKCRSSGVPSPYMPVPSLPMLKYPIFAPAAISSLYA